MAGSGNNSNRNGWTSDGNIGNHFDDHGSGYDSIDDYHSDAWDNIIDPNTISRPGEDGKIGHFNTKDGRLTVTNAEGKKITFFIPYKDKSMDRRRRYFDENFPESN
jgi:hypothetical protein